MLDPASFEIKDPATGSLTVATGLTVMNEDAQAVVDYSSMKKDAILPGDSEDFSVGRSPHFVLRTDLLPHPTPAEMEKIKKEKETKAQMQGNYESYGLFTANILPGPSQVSSPGSEFHTTHATMDSVSGTHDEGPVSPVGPSGYEQDLDEDNIGYYSDSSVEWKFWDGVESDGEETVVESVPDSPESSTSTDVELDALEESDIEPLESAMFEDVASHDGVVGQDNSEEPISSETTVFEAAYESYAHVEITPVVGAKRSCPSTDEEPAPKRQRLATDESEPAQAADLGVIQPAGSSVSAASTHPVSISRDLKRKESFHDAEEPARKKTKQMDLL